MFTIDQNITDLHVKERDIVTVFFSMNIHQVATPEMILEEARSYILFMREGSNRLSAHIALHLRATNRKLYYSYSSNPFPDSDRSEVEGEALSFAEGLGAILDEIDMSKLSREDKNRWLDEQDIFNPKPMQEVSAVEPPAPVPEPAQPTPAPQSVQPLPPEPQVPPTPPVQQPPHHSVAPQPPAPVYAPPVQQPEPLPYVPPAPPVQPVPAAPVPQQFMQPHFQPPQAPVETPAAAPVHSDVQPPDPRSAPLAAAAKRRQDIMQKAAKSGIAKSLKQTAKKERQSPTGVVGREREALARLFTSF